MAALIITCVSCRNKKDPSIIETQSDVFDLTEVLGTWKKIERDSIGYFLYQPCEGKIPGVRITQDSIFLISQIEGPDPMKIDNLQTFKDSLKVLASNRYSEAEFTFKIVEPQQDFILFKWNFPVTQNKGKQIIMKNEDAEQLRKVVDTCLYEKRETRYFLPIEYN